MALKIVGSSPIIHPIKNRGYHSVSSIFYDLMGLERRIRKYAGGIFSRRGRAPNAQAFLSVHFIEGGILSFYDLVGLERRIRKYAGGIFSRRGRAPNAQAFLSVHFIEGGIVLFLSPRVAGKGIISAFTRQILTIPINYPYIL